MHIQNNSLIQIYVFRLIHMLLGNNTTEEGPESIVTRVKRPSQCYNLCQNKVLTMTDEVCLLGHQQTQIIHMIQLKTG